MNRLIDINLYTHTFQRGDFFPEFLSFLSERFPNILQNEFISSKNIFNFLCTKFDRMQDELLEFVKKNLDNTKKIREALIISKLLDIHLELEEKDIRVLDEVISKKTIEEVVFISDEISSLNPYVYHNGKYAAPALIEDKKIAFVSMKIENENPSTVPHETEFDSLSYDQILTIFNSDKFNSLSKIQVKDLCQALSNTYIKTRFPDALPCNVDFSKFERNKRANITFGAYFTGLGEIVMNDDLFEIFASTPEKLAPYLLETIIHESKHRVQYQLNTLGQKTEADRIVANDIFKTLKTSQNNLSYTEYLCEIEELDARNSAFIEFQYMYDHGIMSESMQKHFKESKELEERRASEYEKILSSKDIEQNRRIFTHLYSSSLDSQVEK